MPSTAFGKFGLVSETSSGGGTTSWTNLNNMITDSGDANYAYIAFVNGLNSYAAILRTPETGPDIPVDAEITEIAIRFRGYKNNASSSYQFQVDLAQITGGSQKSSGNFPSSAGYVTLSGDLSYWGITQTQARNLADDTSSNFRFTLKVTGGSVSFQGRIILVEAQFTYRSTLVAPAVLF